MYTHESHLAPKDRAPAQRSARSTAASSVPSLLALQRMAGNARLTRALKEERDARVQDAGTLPGASVAVPVQRARSSGSPTVQRAEEDYSGWAAEAYAPVEGMSSSLFGTSFSGGQGSGFTQDRASAGPGLRRSNAVRRANAPGGSGGGTPRGALQAALVSVDVERIPREAVWRTSREPLYRNDSRPWYIVFAQGFAPKNPANMDLEDFLHSNAPSAYVATTRKKDLNWPFEGGDAYIYEIDAPGGIDANRTYPHTMNPDKYDEAEVDFPGGIAPRFIKGCWALAEDGTRTWIPNDGAA